MRRSLRSKRWVSSFAIVKVVRPCEMDQAELCVICTLRTNQEFLFGCVQSLRRNEKFHRRYLILHMKIIGGAEKFIAYKENIPMISPHPAFYEFLRYLFHTLCPKRIEKSAKLFYIYIIN